MATAQVESATTALHDEKTEEQPIKETEEIRKNTEDQETTVTAQDDQLPVETTEPADQVVVVPEAVEDEPQPEPKAEPEALAAEVETKVVLKDATEVEPEEGKVIPVDQPTKVAPEPCVEEPAKVAEAEALTEPVEVSKAEVEVEAKPEEEGEKKEEA